jgi:hypothetical protein
VGSTIERGIEGKPKKFVPGKSSSDLGKFAIKEDFAVVDDNHPATQFFDILHVMAGQNRGDALLFIVVEQKIPHVFLADYIKADRWFVQK